VFIMYGRAQRRLAAEVVRALNLPPETKVPSVVLVTYKRLSNFAAYTRLHPPVSKRSGRDKGA
jgi:hypothetical protein